MKIDRARVFHVRKADMLKEVGQNANLDTVVLHYAKDWINKLTEDGWLIANIGKRSHDDSEMDGWVFLNVWVTLEPKRVIKFNNTPSNTLTLGGAEFIIDQDGIVVVDSENTASAELSPKEAVELAEEIMSRVDKSEEGAASL